MSGPRYASCEENRVVVRHREKVAGVIGCFDRLIFKSTLLGIGCDQTMKNHLNHIGIPFKEYQQWARTFWKSATMPS